MNKKAIIMDNIATYGMALLVVLIAFGALWAARHNYFQMPESCIFTDNFNCVENNAVYNAQNNTIEFRLKNVRGQIITLKPLITGTERCSTITKIEYDDDGYKEMTTDIALDNNEAKNFRITCSDFSANRFKTDLSWAYENEGSDMQNTFQMIFRGEAR